MLFVLSVLISSIVCNVQAKLQGEGIVGGVEAERHELKYHISLQMMGIDWCGGSIIDDKFVLTAAHCVVGEDNEFLIHFPFKVVAGLNDLNDNNVEDRVEVEVEAMYIPAAYNRTSRKTSAGDIAVLKLKKNLDLKTHSFLAKLNLPASSEKELTTENSYADAEALISGFGWNEVSLNPVKTVGNKTKFAEDGSSNGKLHKAKALVVANSLCQSLYKNYAIGDSHICAKVVQHPSDVHQGVCGGDSGSPLVIDDTVIGLVSFSYLGCNDSKRPAVYTRISAYVGFIDNVKSDRLTDDIRAKVWPEASAEPF